MLVPFALALIPLTALSTVEPTFDHATTAVETVSAPARGEPVEGDGVRSAVVRLHDRSGDRGAILRVEGRVGLTPWEAQSEAERELIATVLAELEREVRLGDASGWLPEELRRRAFERWRSDLDAEDLVVVIENELVEHDHAGYPSYQVRLAARVDDTKVESAMDGLDRQVVRVKRRTTVFALGALGLWGLLGLAFVWFDRLTRGYMPLRTGMILGIVGVALPAAGWFLI